MKATATARVLWEHETKGIAEITAAFKTHNRVLYQAPTAAGKTVIFCEVAKLFPTKRILIIGHTLELLDQISGTLLSCGIKHAILSPHHDQEENARVQVASIQTLVNRLDLFSGFDFIILDEAHHAVARIWRKVVRHLGARARLLGVTATPKRRDKKKLSDMFDVLICGPQPRELIEKGILAKPLVYAPVRDLNLARVRRRNHEYDPTELAKVLNKRVITGDAIKHYRRVADGQKALVFCVNVKHAQDVNDYFNEEKIPAACLHGNLPVSVRNSMVEKFRTGEILVLVTCLVAGEGFDLPDLAVVIDLRPSLSEIRVRQGWGRCMRGAPGKTFAKLLDHAGNSLVFGLPDSNRYWTLEDEDVNEVIKVQRCPNDQCNLVVEGELDSCPECGTSLLIPLFQEGGGSGPYPIYVEGDLQYITDETFKQEPWVTVQRRMRCSEEWSKEIVSGSNESKAQAEKILKCVRKNAHLLHGFSDQQVVSAWVRGLRASGVNSYKRFQQGINYLTRRNIVQTSQSSRSTRWYWFHPFIVNCSDDVELLENGIHLTELRAARGYQLQQKVVMRDGSSATVVRIAMRRGIIYFGLSFFKNGSARRYTWHKSTEFSPASNVLSFIPPQVALAPVL